MKQDRSYVGDCRDCRAKVVDCCEDCEKCVDCCACDCLPGCQHCADLERRRAEAEITVDGLFAQADYYEGVIRGDAP